MGNKIKKSVSVGGETVILNVYEEEIEYINKLSTFVNDVYNYIGKTSKKNDTIHSNILILSALNIADELFQLKAEMSELKKKYYNCEERYKKSLEKIKKWAESRNK